MNKRVIRFFRVCQAYSAGSILALVSLAGCSTISNVTSSIVSAAANLVAPKPVAPDWNSLLITAADDTNQNSPVALDIVFVRDQSMVDPLLATSSGKWFSTRMDMQRSFPEALSVLSLELVPKQSMQVGKKVLQDIRGFTAIVYADYPGPGEHRERLQLSSAGYVVQLGARGFKVAEVKAQ